MSNKSQLLDPIGTAFKLILLNFEPDNTRLTINNHAVELELPDATQSIVRWWYGESREDICYLTNTIVRFIEFYLEDDKKQIVDTEVKTENSLAGFFNKDDTEKKKNLKLMAKYICSGLEKLESVYKLDNATLAMTYFRVLLSMAIDGNYNSQLLPHCIKDHQQNNFLNIDKLKEIWSDSKIDHICKLFTNLFDAKKKDENDISDFYLKGIKEMLEKNDNKFRELVNTIK
jgi:hypothetical protein